MKNTKAKGKKKAYRKQRKYAKRSDATRLVLRSPMGGVIPDKLFTKLQYHYTEYVSLVPPNAQYYTKIFRMNGAYDPDINVSVTAQPMGWHQLAQLYNKYKVHYSKITTKTINNNSNMPLYHTVVPSLTGSSSLNFIRESEQRYSKSAIIPAKGSNDKATLKNKMGIKKITGEAQLDDGYEAYTNTAVSSSVIPLNQQYWVNTWWTADGNETVDMAIDVTIEYYIEFIEPVKLPQSNPTPI